MFHAPRDIQFSQLESIALSFPNKKIKPLMDAYRRLADDLRLFLLIFIYRNNKGKVDNPFPSL
jgi:hypothetical protein